MSKEENLKTSLEAVFRKEIKRLNDIWDYIKENHIENEQYVLDFLDNINEISVRN